MPDSGKVFGSFFPLLVMCVFARQAEAEYGGGTGTRRDPYRIATAEQLISIGSDLNLLDKHFVLVNNIDLDPNLPGGRVFTQAVIAPDTNDATDFQGTAFTGSFDGQDHMIKNLTINGGAAGFLGLFGVIGMAGRVQNLGLEKAFISGSYCAGALAGSSGGKISGCRATSNVSGVDSGKWLGGLVGVNGGSIADCYVTASVSGGSGSDDLGGLVGYNGGNITNCQTTGSVSSASRSYDLGGLAGRNSGSITNCYAGGSVIGGESSRALGGLVGGNSRGASPSAYLSDPLSGRRETWGLECLVGNNGGSVANCYATGSVSGGKDSWVLGGLVGPNGGSIANCYATGSVTCGGKVAGGGLLARNSDGTVSNCFWDVEASGVSSSDGGTGFTTAQMQDAQAYIAAGWDLVGERANGTADLWLIPEGGGYPVLSFFTDSYRPCGLEGTGTPDDPYRIATAEELGALCHYDPSACYELVADVDLSGITWTTAAIGNFDGTFHGAGFAVSDLTVQGGGYLGLFGKLGIHAAVKDLGVEDANIVGADEAIYVGILAAQNRGSVTQCRASGSVYGQEGIGGLLGYNEGSVFCCRVVVEVSGGELAMGLGGLVGYAWAGTIAESYATGTVRSGAPLLALGGLVGYAERGTITRCYATGSVSGLDGVGGLVGDMWQATISHCYATGRVSGGREDEYLGGLVAWNADGTVTDSFWDVETSGMQISQGGMGLTTVQMMDCEVYGLNGWAGDPNWVLDCGNDYPHLVWEGKPGQAVPEPVIDRLDGSGTQEDPYIVATADQLAFISTASILWDKSFVLVSDLDLAGIDFRRVGIYPGIRFTGSFDGNGHVIRNLTIDASGLSVHCLGLFDSIGPGGQVTHLGLENATIKGGQYSEGFGALAGRNRGIVSYCHATGSVTGMTGIARSCGLGGLVGFNAGTISNCHADSDVSQGSRLGGLVGWNCPEATIIDCHATGSVSAGKDGDYLGGLVGQNVGGSIIGSYATGSICGGEHGGRLGGLMGCNSSGGTITQCYATGSVTAGERSYCLGGLVGDCSEGTLAVCYATGGVSSDNESKMLGGLVGCDLYGAISGCYSLTASDGGGPDNGVGVPLTDKQMKQQASFVGWDFAGEAENGTEDIWAICEGQDYPELAWQFVVGDFDDDADTDFADFCIFAARWLGTDSSFWCPGGGTDITNDGNIDFADLKALADNWLAAK